MNEEKQEFIHETETTSTEEPQEISIMDILQMELRRYMETALDYKKKIDSAKTEYKKRYYTKKLKKNNTEALKVLTAIERIKKKNADKPTKLNADVFDLKYPNENDETDDKNIVA